jgi:hypothetical protein
MCGLVKHNSDKCSYVNKKYNTYKAYEMMLVIDAKRFHIDDELEVDGEVDGLSRTDGPSETDGAADLLGSVDLEGFELTDGAADNEG